MIEVRSMCLRRQSFALADITFSVSPSSCHVIAGPSGCGKTLLLETIMGLNRAERGMVICDGRDITLLPPEARGISYVPQDLALFPHLTVEGNVFYAERARRKADPGSRRRILDLAGRIGIAPLFHRYPTSLSGGEKQRVALLRALASGNRVLLLDEPFSALHEGFKSEIWQLIQILCREFGITTILVTHDLREIAFLADTLTVMHYGRVLASGTPTDILERPKTLSLAHFAGLCNLWPAEVLEMADGRISMSVPSLGLKTISEKMLGWGTGRKVHLGIWPSAVQLLREGEDSTDAPPAISAAVIREYGLSNQRTIVCRTSTGGVIESSVPWDDSRIPPTQPASSIRLSLPYDRLFLVGEDDHASVPPPDCTPRSD